MISYFCIYNNNDNLKLYGKPEIESQSLTNIHLTIIDKEVLAKIQQWNLIQRNVAAAAIQHGKITNKNGIEMPNCQIIRCHQEEFYKYLGILQLGDIKHGQVKNEISKEDIQRGRKLLKIQLNGGYMIKNHQYLDHICVMIYCWNY